MPQPRIDILLATYNGVRWLPALLASLEAQTCQDWRLLVRDDGSDDGTQAVLHGFQGRLGNRMFQVEDSKPFPGAMGNFAQLLANTTAPYVMFCDQDDVWLPDKIARTMAAMERAERAHSADEPILVYSDLCVVDENLRVLGSSFWDSQCLNRGRTHFRGLIVQNVVTGCTAMLNRPLVQVALPIPPEAVMHDWWIALVANAFGHLERIDEALILYRQHGANTLGAIQINFNSIKNYIINKRANNNFKALSRQAGAFISRFPFVNQKEINALQDLSASGEANWIRRKYCIIRHRLYIFGWIRNLAWIIFS